jgi:hypothetical protein
MSDSTTSGAPPSSSMQLGRTGVVGEVHLQDVGRLDRIDGQQVDADQLGHAALHGDLQPTPWRAAQVDDADTLLEEAELLVDLADLEGRAAAIAHGARLGRERVVDLPLQPRLLRRASGHKSSSAARAWCDRSRCRPRAA